MNQVFTIYGFCALGVFISVLLPILRRALPKPDGTPAGLSALLPRVWACAKPYVVTGIFSLVVAVLLVAFLQDQLTDWRAALLAGYAADSTLQKMKG